MDKFTAEEQKIFALMLEAVKKVYTELNVKHKDKWIDGKEAMAVLKITSPTTLQKLRDTGAIRYSQPEKKIILYDRDSIDAYIEKNVKSQF